MPLQLQSELSRVLVNRKCAPQGRESTVTRIKSQDVSEGNHLKRIISCSGMDLRFTERIVQN